MFYYRLYTLDPADGHFTDVLHFNAVNDETAIREAESGSRGVARELWNRDRKVMDFAPQVAPSDSTHGPNRLAHLIDQGNRWRWNPLAGHCQLIESRGRESSNDRAAANDRDPPCRLRPTGQSSAREMAHTRLFT